MIVVSNTSPILNLAVIGQLDLLRQLYAEVLIPGAVASELRDVRGEHPGMEGHMPPWLRIRAVGSAPLVQALQWELDAGESEAIVLALDMRSDLLLVDERKARRIAARMGVRVVGILGILLEAKQKGYVPSVKPLVDGLIAKAGFWVSSQLYSRVLKEAGE